MNPTIVQNALREFFAVLQKMRAMYPTLRDDELFMVMFALSIYWEMDIRQLSHEQLAILNVSEIKHLLKEVQE